MPRHARWQVLVFVIIVIVVNYSLGQWIWRVSATPVVTLIRQHYALVSKGLYWRYC